MAAVLIGVLALFKSFVSIESEKSSSTPFSTSPVAVTFNKYKMHKIINHQGNTTGFIAV